MTTECLMCKSNSGEQRISPGPTLYTGRFWYKEYVLCLAEMPGFQHAHVHIVARAHDLPEEFKGSKIFATLKANTEEAIPPAEIKAFCEELQPLFKSGASHDP